MKIIRLLHRKINRISKRLFEFWQKLGFHIIPNHFYYPVPDTRTLKDELWQKNTELVGININEKFQIDLLSQFSIRFKKEYDEFPVERTPIPYQYYLKNPSFNPVDGKIYYSMIRNFKPKKIVEVGAGFSTFLAAQAILKNKEENGTECKLYAIEPFPNDTLKAGFPGLTKLISKKVQDVPLSFFLNLDADDILFIDSSHVITIGSDVTYEFLEIIPRLNKGVIIHFHDIFLPAEFLKEEVLKEHHFWNEQYLLQTFLTFNDCFEILWAGYYMYLNYPDEIKNILSIDKGGKKIPKSFWIRRIK